MKIYTLYCITSQRKQTVSTDTKEIIKMKTITKILALVLSLILMVGCFAGCNDTGEDDTFVIAISPDFAPMEFVDMT